MKLIPTALLNIVAVIVKIFSSLVLNKVLAIFVGPSGYALLGQLQNAMTILTKLASGAIDTGVTKYTAEYGGDANRQHAVWKTAFVVGMLGSVFIGLLILIFHRVLALCILKDDIYANVFIWFAGALVLFVFNALLLAILNGKKEIKRFVVANITGSLLALLLMVGLAFYAGLYGALVALAINQSFVFGVTFLLCCRTVWFRFKYLIGWPEKKVLLDLAKYTVMAITTAVLGPLSQIVVRSLLIGRFGLAAAGHWEALMRISGVYLMLFTTPLSIYYLPRLAELHRKSELRYEILSGYKIFIPMVVSAAVIIFVFRDWIILILFTKEFTPMRDLFAWQMVGDVFKIASWLLSFFFLSKAMTKIFVTTEIFFTSTFLILVWLATARFAEQGVQIAYCINYVFYFICMGFIVWKVLSIKNGEQTI